MVKKTEASRPARKATTTKTASRALTVATAAAPALAKTTAHMAPLFAYRGESYHRVQGVEKYVIGSRHLFFANNDSGNKSFGASGVQLDGGDWFATGTLRNSFYLETISQFTPIRDLSLMLDYQGALNLKLMCAARGKPTEVLGEVKLIASERTRYLLNVGSPTDLPEGARLFWHVDALPGGCTLFDAAYCTRTEPKATRLAVLLRTFGRTTDVKALLKRFAQAGLQDPFYASILENMDFWVLDTTAGAEAEYTNEWADTLNLRVLVGPNLGGGGNAGHMLKLFEDHCRASQNPPNEVLILDDDLSLSMESLARYYTFTAYRSQELVCSLPIMMKSNPLTVWEDGGFWGRLNFHEGGNYGKERNLFPTLLKHGTKLTGYDKLDDFGPLNTCEYSTFIFFGLSLKTLRKLGYPACFFLRGDDIELSLRAAEAGVQMITNPNLAAWHEPAHSYGQEYMAILHGIIINLSYSSGGADFYTRFFEERLYEHASLDDLVGMRLYRDVLAELLNPQSQVLTPEFQHHYLAKLKELGGAKFMKIPERDRDHFEQRARESKTLLVPFVYPGYQKDTRKARNVVLINHSAKAYRELPAVDLKEKSALMADFAQRVAQLDQQFSQVKALWQQRLKATSEEAFWTQIQKSYAAETREIYVTSRNLAACVARIKQGLETKPVATILNGTVTETARTGKLRVSSAAPKAALTKTEAGSALAGKSTSPVSGAVATTASLPADFDPEYYLVINADVKEAGLDPVQHYLNFGRAEGRIYKA